MALIARALLREFPDHADLFDIGALQLGNQYIANHNGLLGRYPGADGWKGPVLGPTGAVTTSADAEGGSATRHRFKGRVRLIRHPAGATAQKLIAARAVKPKTDAGAGDK
jgi:D-alanyl-D-alanine carboxypeptidase